MSNVMYDKARQQFLVGGIDWSSDTIKAVLIDSADYTINAATHEFLSDIPSAARVAVSGPLTGKTSTAGVADADDVSFPSVLGDQAEAIVLFVDTGVEATSRLLVYIDGGTGFPVTPNGGNINVTWSNGSNRIFKL